MSKRIANRCIVALAILLAAVGVRGASAQDDTPTNPPPKEFQLWSNPFTGHIYCLWEGTGCFVA